MFMNNKPKTRITLNPQDSEYLKSIAEKLEISQGEVILRGLEIMNYYAFYKEKSYEIAKKLELDLDKEDPLSIILITLYGAISD